MLDSLLLSDFDEILKIFYYFYLLKFEKYMNMYKDNSLINSIPI